MNVFTVGLYKKIPRGVKIRTWHPAWWIPRLVETFHYKRLQGRRYKHYEEVLRTIYKAVRDDEAALEWIRLLLEEVDCGYSCGYTEPYGYVPEDGCPIHDC